MEWQFEQLRAGKRNPCSPLDRQRLINTKNVEASKASHIENKSSSINDHWLSTWAPHCGTCWSNVVSSNNILKPHGTEKQMVGGLICPTVRGRDWSQVCPIWKPMLTNALTIRVPLPQTPVLGDKAACQGRPKSWDQHVPSYVTFSKGHFHIPISSLIK